MFLHSIAKLSASTVSANSAMKAATRETPCCGNGEPPLRCVPQSWRPAPAGLRRGAAIACAGSADRRRVARVRPRQRGIQAQLQRNYASQQVGHTREVHPVREVHESAANGSRPAVVIAARAVVADLAHCSTVERSQTPWRRHRCGRPLRLWFAHCCIERNAHNCNAVEVEK